MERILAAGLLAMLGFGPEPQSHGNGETIDVRGQPYEVENAARDWSLQTFGKRNCLFRFELRSGDVWVNDTKRGDTAIERTEVEGPSDSRNPAEYGKDVWTAYEFKIEPGPPSTAKFLVLGDWHALPDPGDGPHEYSSWELELFPGDKLTFITHTSPNKPMLDTLHDHHLWTMSEPVARDTWHSVVSRTVFDADPNGHGAIELWFDGQKVVDYTGPVDYRNTHPPYFKFGIYRADAPETIAVQYADVAVSKSSLAARIEHPPEACHRSRDIF
jgi:hypothetical protein